LDFCALFFILSFVGIFSKYSIFAIAALFTRISRGFKIFRFFYYLKIENGTHMRLGDEDETRRAKRRENKSVAHR